MPVSKEDPKHGRWILPLVIVGLLGFTYVFVNALPPADIAASTTSTSSTTTTTEPPTTTSTTLPADIRAFLGEVERFQGVTTEIQSDLHATNEAWEARDITFDQALAGFEDVKTRAETLASEIDATAVPDANGYPDLWPAVQAAASDLVTASDTVIDGLRAPDDGTLRRQAVEDFDAKVAALTAALNAVKAATP